MLSRGEKATAVTKPVCPVVQSQPDSMEKVPSYAPGSLCVMRCCSTWYIDTQRSAPPTATRTPSLSHAAFRSQPSNPLGAPGNVLYSLGSVPGSAVFCVTGAKGLISQIFIVSSAAADNMCVPAGDIDSDVTVSLCPCSEYSTDFVRISKH